MRDRPQLPPGPRTTRVVRIHRGMARAGFQGIAIENLETPRHIPQYMERAVDVREQNVWQLRLETVFRSAIRLPGT